VCCRQDVHNIRAAIEAEGSPSKAHSAKKQLSAAEILVATAEIQLTGEELLPGQELAEGQETLLVFEEMPPAVQVRTVNVPLVRSRLQAHCELIMKAADFCDHPTALESALNHVKTAYSFLMAHQYSQPPKVHTPSKPSMNSKPAKRRDWSRTGAHRPGPKCKYRKTEMDETSMAADQLMTLATSAVVGGTSSKANGTIRKAGRCQRRPRKSRPKQNIQTYYIEVPSETYQVVLEGVTNNEQLAGLNFEQLAALTDLESVEAEAGTMYIMIEPAN
jgi:hypothetical protein